MRVHSRVAIEQRLQELEQLTRAELIVGLREPARRIVHAIHQRAEDLKQLEDEVADLIFEEELGQW